IFTAPTASAVRAVGFYNSAVNSSYAAFLYVNCEAGNPRTGTLVRTKTGTISNPGFFTILFNSPKLIGAGHRFSVVVKLLTPGGNYPVPVEMPIPGYSSKATASAGQSFVSQNGWDWQDITSIFPNTNVCLKAYA
ncbi:MAG: lectin like domain-containing protein, partial [Candidatus Saccharibacteria bacterium]